MWERLSSKDNRARNYIEGLESEIRNRKIRNRRIRNRKIRNRKIRNPKSEIAKSEIAKSETQRVRYWVNRSVSDSAEGEEIENIGFNRLTVTQSNIGFKRCVKGASIGASKLR